MEDVALGKIDKKTLVDSATQNLKRFDKDIIISKILTLFEQTLKGK